MRLQNSENVFNPMFLKVGIFSVQTGRMSKIIPKTHLFEKRSLWMF